ncbi:MAG: nitrous oxide reductase family maturation protein NosD [Promethearchaeota archaeon]
MNYFELNEEVVSQLEQSTSWNFIGTIIIIENNWTAIEAAHDWCTGTGSELDPYIIENITINSWDIGSCITVQNSVDYFIIQNCVLYNASSNDDVGIALNNVTNGKIINNYCHNNYCGIELRDSDNNTIIANSANDNTHGIRLYNSDNNNISQNIANYNIYYGIPLYDSYNNIVSQNSVNDNDSGIYIYDSNTNMILDNIAKINRYGIYIGQSDNNTVSYNIANENDNYGIFLFDSNNNRIFLNSFSNRQNAKNNGTNNMWDNGSIGNYWDDYQGVDSNDDGIGDEPYLIQGVPVGQDNFPIWDDGIEQPTIPFGNHFLLFMIAAIVSIIILDHNRKS